MGIVQGLGVCANGSFCMLAASSSIGFSPYTTLWFLVRRSTLLCFSDNWNALGSMGGVLVCEAALVLLLSSLAINGGGFDGSNKANRWRSRAYEGLARRHEGTKIELNQSFFSTT